MGSALLVLLFVPLPYDFSYLVQPFEFGIELTCPTNFPTGRELTLNASVIVRLNTSEELPVMVHFYEGPASDRQSLACDPVTRFLPMQISETFSCTIPIPAKQPLSGTLYTAVAEGEDLAFAVSSMCTVYPYYWSPLTYLLILCGATFLPLLTGGLIARRRSRTEQLEEDSRQITV